MRRAWPTGGCKKEKKKKGKKPTKYRTLYMRKQEYP
jgi:hypothetical protein